MQHNTAQVSTPYQVKIILKNIAKGAAFLAQKQRIDDSSRCHPKRKEMQTWRNNPNIPHGLQSESQYRTPVTVDMEGSELFEQKFLRSDTIPLTGRDSPMMGP